MSASLVVTTERLVLRPLGLDDVAESTALWGNAATVAFIGDGQPHTAEAVWSRVLRHIGHWQALGYGYWSVREAADDRFVGQVGFQNLRRATEPPLGDRPEVGWVLAPHAQGRGFAREAVAGALAWADARLAAPNTVCIIHPAHERSLGLARRMGYGQTGTARYGAATVTVHVRPRVFQSAVALPTS